jgi:hypothetical protein
MKLPILISYWMLKKDKKRSMFGYLDKNKNDFQLLIDSGAFSAHTQGFEISVDDYCSWIKEQAVEKLPYVDGYFQLDVMNDVPQTRINLIASQKLKTNPIPIFTRARDVKDLDILNQLVRDYPWVGVGSIRGTKIEYVKWVLEGCKDVSRLHLLGFGNNDVSAYYKPKSFDVSTWYMGGLFGEFYNLKTMSRYEKKDMVLSYKQGKEYGFQEKDFDKLNDPDYRNYKGKLMNVSQAAACSAFFRIQERMARIGVTMYFVCINAQQLHVLKRCHEYFIEQKPVDLFTKEV